MKITFVSTCCWLAGLCLMMAAIPLSALALDTTEIKSLYEQAAQEYNAGRYKSAVAKYQKIIDEAPHFAPAYNGMALARKADNAPMEDVLSLLKVATDLDPRNVQAMDNLGKAYFTMGNFPKAEEALQKALVLDPKLSSAKLTMAWIELIGKQEPEAAIRYFKEVIVDGDKPSAYYGMGMSYLMLKDRLKVMDAITSLRSMNQEQLASQLEKMLREDRYDLGLPSAEQLNAMNLPPTADGAGTVEDSTPQTPAGSPPPEASPDTGTPADVQTGFPVRLRAPLPTN